MKNTLPKFFDYDQDKVDAGYEALHDFFLSWTLRCASEEYTSVNFKVQQYAKKIILHLLKLNDSPPLTIDNVMTKKQTNHIDLLVEVTITDALNERKLYVLNIENKWYTPVSKTQLVKYDAILKQKYHNTNAEIVNIVLFPDYEKIEESRALCEASAYTIEVFEDLKELLTDGKTGNDLFDEFWFNFY